MAERCHSLKNAVTTVATLLVVATIFPVLAALLSSVTLIRGVRADLLRETAA